MSLQKFFTAAVVTAGLTMASVAPVSAGMPVAPTSSGNNAEKALAAVVLIGLFAWITTGSAKTSGAAVTRDGGNTSGSFTVLKF
jgi:hypothetical protein